MSFILCRYYERSTQVFKIPLNNVLDIGANNGDWVKLVKQHYPDAKFTMVEPNPIYQEELKKLGEVHDVYLSNLSKTKKFYVAEDLAEQSGNTFYPEKSNVPFSSISVETRTLDHLFADKQFDLIKIDTQGSEKDIIQGGINLVKKASALILEVSYIEYNEGAPTAEEVTDFVKQIGFVKNMSVGEHYDEDKIIQKDILFLNEDI